MAKSPLGRRQSPPSSENVYWIAETTQYLPQCQKGRFVRQVGFACATRRDPTLRVATSGTVVITSVGMFGKGHSGWGIAITPVSLSLVVGSMAWKPAVIEGRVEAREALNLTVMFDHDVVDGAPATRFTRRLLELMESGYGLEEIISPPWRA